MNELEHEIFTLGRQLAAYQKAYYVDNHPLVSDMEYDRLFDRLVALETQHPHLRLPDSPTQRVGSDLDSTLQEVAHTIPVLSLDKAYSDDEMLSWIEKTEAKIGEDVGIVIEEKIDGISIVLYYEDGLLVRAVTRGNGTVGNDVTANVKTIASIPLRLPVKESLAVRGEIYLPKADFARLNAEMDVPFANPRNLAAGTIRRIKSSEVAKVPLQIFVYEGFRQDGMHSDHLQILATLASYGFRLNPNLGYFCKNALQAGQALKEAGLSGVGGSFLDLASYIADHTEKRSSLDYEIDGLVAKVNSVSARELLGYTGHHPRWALAYKFESPQAQTVLQAIDVQVGRTGRVTPVARVVPVQVAGSTISNITLHNQDYINMLELGIGDTVEISRRGDVIPAVERVIEKNEASDGTYKIPSRCPVCNSLLETRGAHAFCPNPDCPAQVKGRIEFFIGKDGMDIENFGPETASVLIELGYLRDVDDVYRIDYRKALADQPGFGEKKIRLIEQGVQKSKAQPFRKVLVALGLPELGKKGAELLLANGITSMEALLDIANRNDVEALTSIKQIGQKSASLYIEALCDPYMQQRIERLSSLGLAMEEDKALMQKLDDSFAGQVWCITGSFEHFNPRSLAMEEVTKRGGRTVSSVTGKTTHLLAGLNAGSKVEAARALNIEVVDEQTFLGMLDAGKQDVQQMQGEFDF